MVAVTAKNTSFDEDLTIDLVKLVLVYNFKKTFRYVTGAVQSISTFGNVLFRRRKQTIIQSEREFGVT